MAWSVQNTILVPFDFTEPSHLAIDKALQLAESPSQIHILHVLPPFVPLAPEGIPIEWSDEELRIQQAQEMLLKEFSEKQYSGTITEILIGDAGTMIADRAAELNAELIVLPSHGRSGLSRLLLGSVAEQIVRLAKCPVLIIKI